MTRVYADRRLGRVREMLVVGLIALFVGIAVYTFLGFAWTVKAAVEYSQKLRHPFGGH